MREPETYDEIDALLQGGIDQAWARSMEVWRPIGRVEDLPRATRRPKYLPRGAKVLGTCFAEKYFRDYPYVIDRLSDADAITSLCAFEILDYMAPYVVHEVEGGADALRSISAPIPEKVADEIECEWLLADFRGLTVGEFLAFGHMDV